MSGIIGTSYSKSKVIGTHGSILYDHTLKKMTFRVEDTAMLEITKDGDRPKIWMPATGTLSVGSGSSTVIGSDGGNGAWLYMVDNHMSPVTAHASAWKTDSTDLGSTNSYFDDVYATNGSIITSDERKKNTITESDLGLDFVNKLSPKSFIFNGKTRTHYGLIAQDVETLLSDIGKTTQEFAGFIKSDLSEIDGTPTGEVSYGLRLSEFISPMMKAIQELSAKNDALEAENTAMKTRMDALEARLAALESE